MSKGNISETAESLHDQIQKEADKSIKDSKNSLNKAKSCNGNKNCEGCAKRERIIRRQNKKTKIMSNKVFALKESLLKEIFTLDVQLKKKRRGDKPVIIYGQEMVDLRINGPFRIVPKGQKEKE
jgi:hypothetical protein